MGKALSAALIQEASPDMPKVLTKLIDQHDGALHVKFSAANDAGMLQILKFADDAMKGRLIAAASFQDKILHFIADRRVSDRLPPAQFNIFRSRSDFGRYVLRSVVQLDAAWLQAR